MVQSQDLCSEQRFPRICQDRFMGARLRSCRPPAFDLLRLGPSPDANYVEIAVLRHHLAVLRRPVPARPWYSPIGRRCLATLARLLEPGAWRLAEAGGSLRPVARPKFKAVTAIRVRHDAKLVET